MGLSSGKTASDRVLWIQIKNLITQNAIKHKCPLRLCALIKMCDRQMLDRDFNAHLPRDFSVGDLHFSDFSQQSNRMKRSESFLSLHRVLLRHSSRVTGTYFLACFLVIFLTFKMIIMSIFITIFIAANERDGQTRIFDFYSFLDEDTMNAGSEKTADVPVLRWLPSLNWHNNSLNRFVVRRIIIFSFLLRCLLARFRLQSLAFLRTSLH